MAPPVEQERIEYLENELALVYAKFATLLYALGEEAGQRRNGTSVASQGA